MKLFNLSYNLITQCLFLISLCAFITSTKSELTFFNHTETTLNDTNVSHNIPFVINLDTYDDGTALVHITRRDPELTANCTNYLRIPAFGLEQIFRIRVIQLNGTVIEINLDLKLDPPNYLGINVITVFAIFFYLARPTKQQLDNMYNDFGAETQDKYKKIKKTINPIFNKIFCRPAVDDIGDFSSDKLITIEIPVRPTVPNESKVEDEKEAKKMDKKARKISEKVFKIIPKTSSSIIKDIFKDGILYSDSDKISKDVHSEIQKMSEDHSKDSENSHVNNIFSANISKTEIKFASDEKTAKLITKITPSKEINDSDKKKIFADAHIEIAIILLKELFNISLEKYGDELQKKISDAILEEIPGYKDKKKEEERIKKLEQLADNIKNVSNNMSKIKEKTEENVAKISNKFKEVSPENSDKFDEISSGIVKVVEKADEINDATAEKMSNDISKKIKDEISKKIQDKIKDIVHNILKQNDNKIEPVTSNEEQVSSKKKQVDDKTEKLGEKIQKDQNIIVYNIYEIRNLFSKIMKETILNEGKNDFVKSLKDEKTEETTEETLIKSLKEILIKEDSKDLDVEHIIYIICAILDSESLLFIHKISKDYIKKLKSHVKTSKHIKNQHIKDNIEDYAKALIVIRVLVEVICKNIPLLIIMAIYTSEIVILGYMS
ncbi:6739_t:CDS:2, partial [Gigaspora rosea]